MGYSEYITKSNSDEIHTSFIKRNILIFILLAVIIFCLKDVVKISYLWPVLIVPVQAFFDSVYRIILKMPAVASKFYIFQAVQPLLLYIALIVGKPDFAWPLFLVLNVLLPVLFLALLKVFNTFDIKLSSDQVEYSVRGGFFLYKIAPLLIYLALSLGVSIFPEYLNESYMIIRISYFVTGIILLFLYSGGELAGAIRNRYFIASVGYSVLVFLLFAGYSFSKGYFIFTDIELFSVCVSVVLCSSVCFSIYLLKYINWLKSA